MFAELFPRESLDVYGIHLPKIVHLLPTNLPKILANELRIDNLFELEDGSIAIIDYESAYHQKNKIKYLEYVVRIIKRYCSRNLHIRVIILYTADVLREHTNSIYDVGAVKLTIEQAFLSELDSEEIRTRLMTKIGRKISLTNRELMEFIILPLTYQGTDKKKQVINELFQTAKEIDDEKTLAFLLTGLTVFSDKVIDESVANQMKEWIMMTKVARLFEEEKIKAVEETKRAVTKEVTKEISRTTALECLRDGLSVEKTAKYVPALSIEEIQELAESMND